MPPPHWPFTVAGDSGRRLEALLANVPERVQDPSSLVGRSARKDPQLLRTSLRPELANHSAASTRDHYYRQVLVTETTVRNLRYQGNL